LYIPDELISEFMDTYTRTLEDGKECMYIVERRTPIFKMMCDLDFFDHMDGKDRSYEYRAAIETIQRTMCELGFSGHVVVCGTEDKVIDATDDHPVLTKTGKHLVWPTINVNDSTALLLRHGFIKRLETVRGERPKYNSWNDVVDERIYTANGMRMIGSRKTERCPNCNRKGCENCNKRGWIDIGRIYRPEYVISSDVAVDSEELDRLTNSVGYMVHQLSIRCPGVIDCSPRELTRDMLPSWFEIADVSQLFTSPSSSRRKRKASVLNGDSGGGDDDDDNDGEIKSRKKRFKLTSGANSVVQMATDDPRYSLISEFIRSRMPYHPSVTKISIMKHTNGNIGCYVANTDSKYCSNKMDVHKSSTVYFIVSKVGVFQRCFSIKSDIRKGGGCKCSEFKGLVSTIPDPESLLFKTNKTAAKKEYEKLFANNGLHKARVKPGQRPSFNETVRMLLDICQTKRLLLR
jgi:hypothetical protein